jgi:hypothetical protein
MPWTATAAGPPSCGYHSAAERAFLLKLQQQALQYFLDNQIQQTGLVLDRQRNFGPPRRGGLVSTAATGMGFIATALASAFPYRLIGRQEAVARVRRGLETALERLPHSRGAMPHFLDATTGKVVGNDARSTIDSAWLVAGALWAAAFLGGTDLRRLAAQLFRRLEWRHWTAPGGLIRHGADSADRPLAACWDRLNGETVFMYVLAAGADESQAWPAQAWRQLRLFSSETGGLYFTNADLGLFVFQYGVDLLDLASWRLPGDIDLTVEAALATEANARVCRAAADRFVTYQRFWGLSAGDGPGPAHGMDTYRCYSPRGPFDGTAHISATVPGIAHRPALVWENLRQAHCKSGPRLRGRYGFSNVNLDRQWVAGDMVGIDAGAIVLALDNCLVANRVRRTFHGIEAVQCGLERLGCAASTPLRLAS